MFYTLIIGVPVVIIIIAIIVIFITNFSAGVKSSAPEVEHPNIVYIKSKDQFDELI